MKSVRVLAVITLINLGAAAVNLLSLRAAAQPDVAAIVRTRALQIVDDRGRVRASLEVLRAPTPAAAPGAEETVLLHLITERGRPSVKISASEESAGLSVAGPSGTSDTYVILQAKGKESSLKLRNEDRREHPHLAATVFEKPPVDTITARAIARRGCSERIDVVAGDMLAGALASEADVHLYSNVLYDWDEPVVRQLIVKSVDALPPGWLILIHAAFLNAAKDGPLHVAEYSVLLMHACEGRCYSKGQKARAGLLIALAYRPELLVLDEPSSGLDPIVRRDILGAVIRTIAGEGRTVLFSSHLLEEVEQVADHVTMTSHGRIVVTGALAALKQSRRVGERVPSLDEIFVAHVGTAPASAAET